MELNKLKIGFIGVGKMGGAVVKGILKTQKFSKNNIYLKGGSSSKTKEFANSEGLKYFETTKEIIKNSDIIIIGVIPKVVNKILEEMKEDVTPDKLFISLAGQPSLKKYKEILGNNARIVRTIPNMPVEVLEGMTSIVDENTDEKDINIAKEFFELLGEVALVNEGLLEVTSSLAGSSTAFVDIFIEAMADGAVYAGLPRKIAYEMASQTVKGSAELAKKRKVNPALLKDEVTVPGGTTIKGVLELEEGNFRATVIKTILKTMGKI